MQAIALQEDDGSPAGLSIETTVGGMTRLDIVCCMRDIQTLCELLESVDMSNPVHRFACHSAMWHCVNLVPSWPEGVGILLALGVSPQHGTHIDIYTQSPLSLALFRLDTEVVDMFIASGKLDRYHIIDKRGNAADIVLHRAIFDARMGIDTESVSSGSVILDKLLQYGFVPTLNMQYVVKKCCQDHTLDPMLYVLAKYRRIDSSAFAYVSFNTLSGIAALVACATCVYPEGGRRLDFEELAQCYNGQVTALVCMNWPDHLLTAMRRGATSCMPLGELIKHSETHLDDTPVENPGMIMTLREWCPDNFPTYPELCSEATNRQRVLQLLADREKPWSTARHYLHGIEFREAVYVLMLVRHRSDARSASADSAASATSAALPTELWFEIFDNLRPRFSDS